jgi:N-acetylmuramoyl-L-alanine amidase
MSRKLLTAATAALSLFVFGAFGTYGQAAAVWASDTPTDTGSGLLPRSVLVEAQAEGQTPALPLPDLSQSPAIDRAPFGSASSLAGLVNRHRNTQTANREAECLAGAIYFESKGEPLDGQLAVAQVIKNRANSGRFPASICSVVFQPGQFSFVRSGGFPPIARAGNDWKTAVAISHIAQNELWDSSVQNALFFHARRVSPGWKLRRVAAVGNHVFYR